MADKEDWHTDRDLFTDDTEDMRLGMGVNLERTLLT
jgi:hypothetical protein